MKRLSEISLLVLAASVLFLGSVACRRMDAPGPVRSGVADKVRISFEVEEPTRAAAVGASEEMRIARWALLVFDIAGRRVAEVRTAGSGGIQVILDEGAYTVCAVVNYPSSGMAVFDPEAFASLGELQAATMDLSYNAPSSLVMYGSKSITVTASEPFSEIITVRRLVSKVSVRRVSVDKGGELAGTTVVLKGIYVTNALRAVRLGGDFTAAQLFSTSRGTWYNTLGLHGGEGAVTGYDAVLADDGLDVTLTPISPYVSERVYYPYPNAIPSGSDTNAEGWSPRCTRIVFEATVDGQTYYYPVTLPAMQRNHSYNLDDAVIRRYGSTDPEGRGVASVDVTWSVVPDGWEGPVTVSEVS